MPARTVRLARRIVRTRRPLLALIVVVLVVAIGLIGRAAGYHEHRAAPAHASAPRVASLVGRAASHTGSRAVDAARW